MWEGAALLALAAIFWFWFDSLRARERAVAEASRASQRYSLQFLDETVECISIWPKRNAAGHLALRRIYEFEFSDNGDNRRSGNIVMLGNTVESINMEPFLLQ